MMLWTKDEKKELEKYFTSNRREMTVYQRLIKINPARTYEAMMRQLRKMRSEGWTKNNEAIKQTLRVGYLDIEATKLDADFGFMLSWYIKTAGKNEYRYSVITPGEIRQFKFDERVTKELLEAIKDYDVLWTHYGSDRRFDVPFVRTRALVHKLEDSLPAHMEVFIRDTYPIARNKLKLSRNSLDNIANVLGVDNVKKTPLSKQVWMRAGVGCEESLMKVALHNKRDVQVLERVHKRLSRFEPANLTSM